MDSDTQLQVRVIPEAGLDSQGTIDGQEGAREDRQGLIPCRIDELSLELCHERPHKIMAASLRSTPSEANWILPSGICSA